MARDLARVLDPGAVRREGYLLGNQYVWTWALGHLGGLAGPEVYAPALQGRWDLTHLPVVPAAWQVVPRAGRDGAAERQLAVVKNLLAQATEVIVATDAGREGELIWSYIRGLSGYTGPERRLWLSETTPAAVTRAFTALEPPHLALRQAAEARARADWLVGMNATMALSTRHGGLWSAGRVQTPTLAMLVRREEEVKGFVVETFWTVDARCVGGGVEYGARVDREDNERLAEADAKATATKLTGQGGTVTSAQVKVEREQPPHLMSLTDLQRAANSAVSLTAAETLAAAQALYEAGNLSYPRTDSRYLTPDAYSTLPARLAAVAAALPPLAALCHLPAQPPGARVVDATKVSDHHALLPTDKAPSLAGLPEAQRQVYELVARRTVAALLSPAEWRATDLVAEIAGETLRARSRVLITPGWRAAEPASSADPAPDLSGIAQGAAATCASAAATQRQTQPPKRFTDASLLGAMETAGKQLQDPALREAMAQTGLGTPATRAATIETLIARGYAERQKKAIAATDKGIALVSLAPPSLTDPATTGEWEQRLREIEEGTQSAAEMDRDMAALAAEKGSQRGSAGRWRHSSRLEDVQEGERPARQRGAPRLADRGSSWPRLSTVPPVPR